MPTKTFIHLGRYGDVLNTLPLLKHRADEGHVVQQVIAAKYADVLDGVSYVRPIVYPGAFEDLRGALDFARMHDPKAVNLQVYGKDMPMKRHTTSFVIEQWQRAGLDRLWGTLPLVLDRRDATREAALLAQVRGTDARPLVLLAVSGYSSPFHGAAELVRMVQDRFGDRANVVVLDAVKATRVYDLLGLFDAAACLVTIDTMHMHLAQGSRVPVIGLATDGPTPWHASARRPGMVCYAHYHEWPARAEEILSAIGERIPPPSKPMKKKRTATTKSAPPPTAAAPRVAAAVQRDPRIIHTYPAYAATGDAARRQQTAQQSWQRAYTEAWTAAPYAVEAGARSARDIGDARDLPFVVDMVEAAIATHQLNDHDVVLLTNSDACLADGITFELQHLCALHGACYTHRWDFPWSVEHIDRKGIHTGKWYPGSDAFAFTVWWWRKHSAAYPDMLMGAEYVDAVLRQLIKRHAHPQAELHLAVYHEQHANAWSRDRHSAANLHNARLARAWFAQHGCDDLDPFDPNAAQSIRSKRGTPLYLQVA
jgi:hypothetical protein